MCLMDLIPTGRSKFDGMNDKLVVDGANGVGGAKLKVLQKLLNVLHIVVRNSSEDDGVLNDGVGADYVQKEKIVPRGFDSKDVGIRCASLDSDADQLVYFSVLPESTLVLTHILKWRSKIEELAMVEGEVSVTHHILLNCALVHHCHHHHHHHNMLQLLQVEIMSHLVGLVLSMSTTDAVVAVTDHDHVTLDSASFLVFLLGLALDGFNIVNCNEDYCFCMYQHFLVRTHYFL